MFTGRLGLLYTRHEAMSPSLVFAFDFLLLSFLRCSLYFVKIHVPETKGLTLEQIEQQFAALSRVVPSSEMEPLLIGA
jgi:hypothetical protein